MKRCRGFGEGSAVVMKEGSLGDLAGDGFASLRRGWG